jgi:hypothetical protein
MKFISKAQTLKTLKTLKIKNTIIPKLFVFTVKNFLEKKENILNYINLNFSKLIAVRSSNLSEDSQNKTFAGFFKSFLKVNPKNKYELEERINETINSYKKFKNYKNEIIIQEMVDDVIFSGVVTTVDITTGLPFFKINYSRNKDTTIVTSGKKNTKVINYFKNKKFKTKNKIFNKLINIIQEIEKKINRKIPLEIEFAINKWKKIFILQVRPVQIKKKIISSKLIEKLFNKLTKKIIKLKIKNPSLLGKTTFFGTMPDWNPAEIIGIKPKPLALSLYQELITNDIWSAQRANFGYRDISHHHLLTTFFGTPYVDVRIDFNSWLPSDLDHKISEKLVNYYLLKYKNNISYHDKIEFEIIFTCWNFSLKNKIKVLQNKFQKSEINKIYLSLKNITNIAFNKFDEDINRIEILKKRQKIIKTSKIYFFDQIYWLVNDCKKYGTYAFANLARSAFISQSILNSLVEIKLINKEEKKYFLSEIKTILSEIQNSHNKLTKKKFLEIFGHIRPNMYEITSLNYKDGYKYYFRKNKYKNIKIKKKIIFNKKKLEFIDLYLKKEGININSKNLLKFIKNSIIAREYSKFIFSKSIDMIFENIKKIGVKYNIVLKDLSFLKISTFLDMYYDLSDLDVKNYLKKEISANKKKYQLNKSIKLPDNIISNKDIYINTSNKNKINFFGKKKITGEIIILNKSKTQNLENKIICIENADPGYDFIFSKGILGLITKYGGVNSHMSIRCIESNTTAAIGIGHELYENIITKNYVTIDPDLNKIYSV